MLICFFFGGGEVQNLKKPAYIIFERSLTTPSMLGNISKIFDVRIRRTSLKKTLAKTRMVMGESMVKTRFAP